MKNIMMLGKLSVWILILSCLGFADQVNGQEAIKLDIVKQDSLKQDTILVKPLAVYQVLKPSCMPCHSEAGRDKPRNAVNFSVWQKYTQIEQKMLAASIQTEINKKSMPPKGFLNSHPTAALTDDQIIKLSQWCDSVKSQSINLLAK